MDFDDRLSRSGKMADPERREVQDIQKSKKRRKRKFRSGNSLSIKTVKLLTVVIGIILSAAGIAALVYAINFGIQIYISN